MGTSISGSSQKDCQKIQIILENDIKDNWGFFQGVYQLSDETINGRPSWKSKSKSCRIWYCKCGYWLVGRSEDDANDCLAGIRYDYNLIQNVTT